MMHKYTADHVLLQHGYIVQVLVLKDTYTVYTICDIARSTTSYIVDGRDAVQGKRVAPFLKKSFH